MNEAVSTACRLVGTQAALARALGVTASTVGEWLHGARPVPLERCVDIERLTGVAGEVLRPDQAEFFAYLRSHPMPAAVQAVAEAGAHG
jgi:DNA-binding transcriptional regulator YdaS (Cro superfamily)